ncbi:hypothetical protein Acsp04_63650 [Actinomadura sp. NBRC 104425]|nr:hypothetical protein [Actinomadura sp. NBRC 104425]GLZ16130.1 hypothetical protein Acsp04_63650 [Actinomadura sp. NBRC 104425]
MRERPEAVHGSGRYWRIRVWLEVIKASVWIVVQWVYRGPFGH